ncbi:hypothetical protein F889_01557 [Acinetobacter colistiniresistens]|uniref:Uncharacterized protein n=1 Tax=Acinetobacter colistiniresistens TaxID=280145 RepID=N9R6Z1_9GAMM|nr:hypothetical protein [Acinetobacter colistiniresistens]ENX34917.1 hypothetical protein F889_01557 [Acinetobacter colistiniresistens]
MIEQNQDNLGDLNKQILLAKQQVDHWGTVSTRGKTPEEAAQIDEQFYLANSNLKKLKKRRQDLVSKLNAKTSLPT